MSYEFRNGKVVTKAIEYSVAYHCNLRCSGCSHMSPFLNEQYPSLESFASDIVQLSKGLHAGEIRLCGGEPLLNPEINSFLKIARRSGIADSVNITTNGLVLNKMDDEFWASVDSVVITLYPQVRLKEETVERFKRQAEESDTKLNLFSNPVFRTTIVTEPQPKDLVTDLIFKTCENVHVYHCHTVHEGKLYKCAVPPFLPEYLDKIGMAGYDPDFDAFDIHGARNIYEEVKSFLLCTETLEACRYCLGYLGKTQDHHQLEPALLLDPGLQNITRKSHFDFHKLNKLLKSQIEDCDETKLSRKAPMTSGEISGPKCSVVIPVHNRARHIRRAVNSVLKQSFQDFEIIIADDCSTDETVRIVQELAGCDPRIKLFRHKKNMGAQAARNTGISNATAQYIAFLDSDDEWLPERLRLGFEVVARESVLVVHSAGMMHDGQRSSAQKIEPISGNIYADVLANPGPMFQGLLVKKECLERIDGLDESIISWQEWDTVIRLARHFEFGYVSVPCFVWHRHEGVTISQDQFRCAMGYCQIVEKHREQMLRVVGQNTVMEHYLKILAWLRNSEAYNEFQEVKTKLNMLIKTSRSNEAVTTTTTSKSEDSKRNIIFPSQEQNSPSDCCNFHQAPQLASTKTEPQKLVESVLEENKKEKYPARPFEREQQIQAPDNEESVIRLQLLDFQNTPARDRQSGRNHYKDSYRHRKFFEGLRDELIRSGVTVEDIDIDIAGFEQWLNEFPVMREFYSRLGSYSIEKNLEHYLVYKYLKISGDDVYIDIAASGSPWANALKDRGVKSYRLDLIYPKGVNGIDIGADATDTHLPDSCATVLSAQCAYECFRGNADIDFIDESVRVLNDNGRLGIVPLYLEDRHMIVTSPYCNQKDVPLDDGAERIWRDDEWKEEAFSRHYSLQAFVERIYSHIPRKMQAKVLYFRNLPELMLRYPGQHIYCFFMLYCEMVRSDVLVAAANYNDTLEGNRDNYKIIETGPEIIS